MSEPNIVEQCLETLACTDDSITSDRQLLVLTSIAVSLKQIAFCMMERKGWEDAGRG